ncbi:unnamed protein product [marine sediment metagenome]|uniref:Uncharacterized protein n=1 Tax=marine sediment metagenome TaxID=412755 RepID=X1CHM4_9ZZZZ
MTELEELTKIRKLLEWLVRDKMRTVQGAEFKESDVGVLTK